jgi:hypothetical protein
MSLDDIDLELPEALAEIDLEERAGELEGSQKAHGVRVRPSLGMNRAGRFPIDRARRSGHQKAQVRDHRTGRAFILLPGDSTG